MLILDDPSIRTKVVETVKTERTNSEAAVHDVFEQFASRFRASPDQALREKSLDVEDVCDRILAAAHTRVADGQTCPQYSVGGKGDQAFVAIRNPG